MKKGKEVEEKIREEDQLRAKEAYERASGKTEQLVEEKPLEAASKEELIQKIKELQVESKKNYELYLRAEADAENLKKRTKKEKEEWIKYANEKLIKELLPVLDNLENAVSHSKNKDSFQALKEGVELTLKGFKDTLMKSGLEEIKAQDESFDPNCHHAVFEQEDEEVEAGVVCQELQKGYTFNQRLIRPAMVVVSKGKPVDETDPGNPS
jgi:molecular chaperone GrpE